MSATDMTAQIDSIAQAKEMTSIYLATSKAYSDARALYERLLSYDLASQTQAGRFVIGIALRQASEARHALAQAADALECLVTDAGRVMEPMTGG